MDIKDPRWWILDPVGHRQATRSPHRDGDVVDTAFGEAVVIVPPPPPDDEWICDFCNQPILVKWGDEPFPVPMFSGYAFCLDHYNEAVADWTHDDPHTGEATDIPMGPWPDRACGCDACVAQFVEWRPYFAHVAAERV